MKQFFFSTLFLALFLVSCTKDENTAPNFVGTYTGIYTKNGISFENITAKVTEKTSTEVNIVLDLGAVNNNLTATADSKTKLTIPTQKLDNQNVTGTGTLKDDKELSLTINYPTGTPATFVGTK
jgi:hypothetical protein